MILSGKTLRMLKPVKPFVERTREFGMTYGCGPAGYDVRLDQTIDLRSGKFALGSTMEEFTMPLDVIGFVKDKSTWARQGLCVQNTVIEPGWSGFLTLELTNHGEMDLYLIEGMPIAQIIFQRLDEASEGYEGKYQNQKRGPQKAIADPDTPTVATKPREKVVEPALTSADVDAKIREVLGNRVPGFRPSPSSSDRRR
jgi:dCTP deaminase